MSELLFLAMLLGLPALLAMMLPSTARWIAIVGGVIGAMMFLFALPNGGADSPVNIFAAVICVGCAVGAGLTQAIKTFNAKSAAPD